MIAEENYHTRLTTPRLRSVRNTDVYGKRGGFQVRHGRGASMQVHGQDYRFCKEFLYNSLHLGGERIACCNQLPSCYARDNIFIHITAPPAERLSRGGRRKFWAQDEVRNFLGIFFV